MIYQTIVSVYDFSGRYSSNTWKQQENFIENLDKI